MHGSRTDDSILTYRILRIATTLSNSNIELRAVYYDHRTAIAKRIAYRSPVLVCVLLFERSWTLHSPFVTTERERSILGRRSQVMSPSTSSIAFHG